jgi:hypothetical protein
MIGIITSEKSGSFEKMGVKLYIWMRPGLIRIMPLTTRGYQLMALIFSFGKKNKITPINQTLLTITSVQNYQPFTFSRRNLWGIRAINW